MPKKFEPIQLTREFIDLPSPGQPEGLYLHVSDPRVVDLPREGCITFRFTRGPATITEATGDEPARASVDLQLTEICEVEETEMEDLGETKNEAAEKLDELFEKASSEEEEDDAD